MTATRLKAEDVCGALDAARVLDHAAVKFRRCGSELRTSVCPKCGPRSRDCVCFDVATGVWCDHAHGCRGDLLAAVAGFAGLDIAVAYPRVIQLAAEIAGITHEADPEMERRLAARRQAEIEQRAREQAERDAARARMPVVWDSLDRRSCGGERYLDLRGIASAELRHVVRYTVRGEPALPLRDPVSGEIVGVQYRRLIADDGPKVVSMRGSRVASSVLWGKASDLDSDGADVAVIAEGLADTLVAHLAFRGCAIFGAPGAEQLEAIATAIAPRVRDVRGLMLFVPHNDRAGIDNTASAVRAAQRAGLVLDRDIHLVDLAEHGDLADAWRAGIRFQLPTRRGVG